jgi:hypothetical protein
VAERFVVPMKPGNAGGGKGPQFKAGAESGDAQEIGVTLRNSGNVRELRKAPHAEVKDRPGSQSGERMSAQVAALAVAWRTTVQNYSRGFTIPAVARVAYARPSVSERMRLVREPDAGDLHVRFDERDVETGLRQGYVGTVRRKRRQQTSQTYCYRATSRLYRTEPGSSDGPSAANCGRSPLRSKAVVDRCLSAKTVIRWMGLSAAARRSILTFHSSMS